MSHPDSWSIVSKSKGSSNSNPPPYEADEDADIIRPQTDSNTASASPYNPEFFCCPFDTSSNLNSDSPSILSSHEAWTFRKIGPQTDDAAHGKFNRFFLWAKHSICRKTPPNQHDLKTVPWVYMIELIDYSRCKYSEQHKPPAHYFVARLDNGHGGFESLPYGRGNGVRMTNLTLKANLMMKCIQHENWYEVNFYC